MRRGGRAVVGLAICCGLVSADEAPGKNPFVVHSTTLKYKKGDRLRLIFRERYIDPAVLRRATYSTLAQATLRTGHTHYRVTSQNCYQLMMGSVTALQTCEVEAQMLRNVEPIEGGQDGAPVIDAAAAIDEHGLWRDVRWMGVKLNRAKAPEAE